MENEKEPEVALGKPMLEKDEAIGASISETEFISTHIDEVDQVLEPHGIDYSSLSKKELVEHAKELLPHNDFKNIDVAVREIKNASDAIRDHEKSDALVRFKQSGGLEEDFEFKLDELDHRLYANLKTIR
jgi:hypothetical protein